MASKKKPKEESKSIMMYGISWARGKTIFGIELWCYKNNWGPDFKRWHLLMPEGQKSPDKKLLESRFKGKGPYHHFKMAFQIAWPKFFWHDWFEMEMSAWCKEKQWTAIGHTRASKTYGVAYLIWLDFMASPMDTLTTIASMSLERLRSTMGRDILEAIANMAFVSQIIETFEIVNSTNEFRISLRPQPGMNMAEAKRIKSFGIIGVAIKGMSTTQIQGRHTARRRMIGDETAGFPDAYFIAEKNASSAEDFKGVHLANPNEKTTKFGMSCEPEGGWNTVDENTLYYRSKVGRLILHFNGLKSFNMKLYADYIQKKITKEEYETKEAKFLIRQDFIAEIEVGTLEYYLYVLGWFPTDGLVNRVYPDNVLDMAKIDILYDFKPNPLAVCDPAYEADDCILHIGEYGKQRDGRIGIQMKKTYKVPIEMKTGEVKEFQIARRIMKICIEEKVLPSNFAIDCTGNGRAVAAILDNEWGPVHRIEWGGSPSERPMSASDSKIAKDLYCYFVDELAFRLRYWMMSGRMGGLQNLNPKTIQQLGPRQYIIRPDGRTRIEDKKTYKKRLGESPDYGDALKCLGELMAIKGIFPDAIDVEGPGDQGFEESIKRAVKANEVYEEEYGHEEEYNSYCEDEYIL